MLKTRKEKVAIPLIFAGLSTFKGGRIMLYLESLCVAIPLIFAGLSTDGYHYHIHVWGEASCNPAHFRRPFNRRENKTIVNQGYYFQVNL